MNASGKAGTLDFVVIGAQKAGTTSLFEYLRCHPALYLPPGKEEQFFSAQHVYERGWDAYVRRAFHGAPATSLWGTATPQYMSGGVSDADGHPIDGVVAVSAVPKRMRRQIPEAKLIAVLRDPVQRCFSHYQMLAMRGIETRPFDVLVRELLAPEALRQAREAPVETSGYVVRGEYGRILAPYFDEFPRESIHTVFSDELAAHPSRTVAEIFSFLGVDAGFVPPNIGQRYRVGRDRPRHPVVNAGAVQKAFANNTSIRRMWQRLPADTQHRVQYHAARLSYGIDLWNRSAAPATSAPLPDVHDELRALYANDRSKLVSLIRREIPW